LKNTLRPNTKEIAKSSTSPILFITRVNQFGKNEPNTRKESQKSSITQSLL
jgi:hypothetical protein